MGDMRLPKPKYSSGQLLALRKTRALRRLMLDKVSGAHSRLIHAGTERTVPDILKKSLIGWQKTSLLGPKWAAIRKSSFR